MPMNWLAHLHLSKPDAGFRLGNLLPDFLGPRELKLLPALFQEGIACHRAIDSFTDAHPVVRRSIRRLGPAHQRFGGIIIDLLYDHFLAARWEEFSPVPLAEFARECYAQMEAHRALLPAEVNIPLDCMRAENWLCTYRDVSGFTDILRRVGNRFRRPVNLTLAMEQIETHRDSLEADFALYFPELQQHVWTRDARRS